MTGGFEVSECTVELIIGGVVVGGLGLGTGRDLGGVFEVFLSLPLPQTVSFFRVHFLSKFPPQFVQLLQLLKSLISEYVFP